MSHLMKSSAIKNSGKTNKNENYPTPVSLVRKMVKQAIMSRTIKVLQYKRRPIRVLDIGAGNGVWGIVAKEELEKLGLDVYLVGIEVDDTIQSPPEFDEWIQADFHDVTELEPFDFIFTNPPFSLVYEITEWAMACLSEWGIYMVLIGSGFMFAQTKLDKHMPTVRPLYEIKLTRRPSFKQIFAERRGDSEGKRTSAKDYCVYVFGGQELSDWLISRMPVYYYALDTESTPWITFDQYWDYEEDPLEAILVERPVTVQQALIRDAAEAKGSEVKWDFYWSLMTANEYGWDYYYGTPEERLDMIDAYVAKHTDRSGWGDVWEEVEEDSGLSNQYEEVHKSDFLLKLTYSDAMELANWINGGMEDD